MELTKSALLAALEGFKCWTVTLFSFKFVILIKPFYLCIIAIFLVALGPGSLFGLATFSHKLGLYDVQGPIPVVKNVFIPPDTEGTMPIELEDVMPLLQFLAPVCQRYQCILPLYFLQLIVLSIIKQNPGIFTLSCVTIGCTFNLIV